MTYSLTDVQYTICSNQGDLFEYLARSYTFDTFTAFVPAFMNSYFCRMQWDTPYSKYQFGLIDENLDLLLPELKKTMAFTPASENDQIFNPDVAHWIGFTYRELQILTKIISRSLIKAVTIDDLCAAYPGLHTISDEMAAERLIEDKITTLPPSELEFDKNPLTLKERSEQVYATLAIENMDPGEEFRKAMELVDEGKMTIDELRQKVLNNEI